MPEKTTQDSSSQPDKSSSNIQKPGSIAELFHNALLDASQDTEKLGHVSTVLGKLSSYSAGDRSAIYSELLFFLSTLDSAQLTGDDVHVSESPILGVVVTGLAELATCLIKDIQSLSCSPSLNNDLNKLELSADFSDNLDENMLENQRVSNVAIKSLGFFLYHQRFLKCFSERQCQELFALLCQIVLQSQQKSVIHTALWCISTQRIPPKFLQPLSSLCIQTISHILKPALPSGAFLSEALNTTLSLIKKDSSLMHITMTLNQDWLIKCGASSWVACAAVQAHDAPDRLEKYFTDFFFKDWKRYLHEFFNLECSEKFSLKLWSHLAVISGKWLYHHNATLNVFLSIIERCFNSGKVEIRKMTYLIWRKLIFNFSGMEYSSKRISLLMTPLISCFRTESSRGVRIVAAKTFLRVLYLIPQSKMNENIQFVFDILDCVVRDENEELRLFFLAYLRSFLSGASRKKTGAAPIPKRILEEDFGFIDLHCCPDIKWVRQKISKFLSIVLGFVSSSISLDSSGSKTFIFDIWKCLVGVLEELNKIDMSHTTEGIQAVKLFLSINSDVFELAREDSSLSFEFAFTFLEIFILNLGSRILTSHEYGALTPLEHSLEILIEKSCYLSVTKIDYDIRPIWDRVIQLLVSFGQHNLAFQALPTKVNSSQSNIATPLLPIFIEKLISSSHYEKYGSSLLNLALNRLKSNEILNANYFRSLVSLVGCDSSHDSVENVCSLILDNLSDDTPSENLHLIVEFFGEIVAHVDLPKENDTNDLPWTFETTWKLLQKLMALVFLDLHDEEGIKSLSTLFRHAADFYSTLSPTYIEKLQTIITDMQWNSFEYLQKFPSDFLPQLESLIVDFWLSVIGSFERVSLVPYDSAFLCKVTPVLKAGFNGYFKNVFQLLLEFWNLSFGSLKGKTALKYPADLVPILHSIKKDKDKISLPFWDGVPNALKKRTRIFRGSFEQVKTKKQKSPSKTCSTPSDKPQTLPLEFSSPKSPSPNNSFADVHVDNLSPQLIDDIATANSNLNTPLVTNLNKRKAKEDAQPDFFSPQSILKRRNSTNGHETPTHTRRVWFNLGNEDSLQSPSIHTAQKNTNSLCADKQDIEEEKAITSSVEQTDVAVKNQADVVDSVSEPIASMELQPSNDKSCETKLIDSANGNAVSELATQARIETEPKAEERPAGKQINDFIQKIQALNFEDAEISDLFTIQQETVTFLSTLNEHIQKRYVSS